MARIYITFESLWQGIINSGDSSTRTNAMLSDLFSPGLLRSERLRLDISSLTGKSLQEVDENLSHYPKNNSALSRFLQHIQSSVALRPHVLVAFAFVLYMALFSGGRIIRATLYNAGPGFWHPSPSRSAFDEQPAQPEIFINSNLNKQSTRSSELGLPNAALAPGLATTPGNEATQPLHQFFHFPGNEDGEDLKREFKRHFAGIETWLSDREKMDIVEAAQQIFHFINEIVEDLDTMCNTKLGPREDTKDEHCGNSVGQNPYASAREKIPRGRFRGSEVTQPCALLTASHALDFAMILWICLALLYLVQR